MIIKGDVTLDNPGASAITLSNTEFDGGSHTVEAPAEEPAPAGLQPALA